MTSQPRRGLLACLLAGVSLTAGCVGGSDRRDWAEAGPPRMPMVAPPPARPAPPVPTDAEVVAAMIRAQQAGDAAAVRRAIDGVTNLEQRQRVGVAAVTELARSDPAQAARLAERLPISAGQLPALDGVAETWTQRDADAALRWTADVTDPIVATEVRRAVAQALVRVGPPAAALDRISALPAGAARDDVLGFAAAAWARTAPDDAVTWLRARPDGELKRRLTSAVGFEIAQRSPDRAIELAETLPAGRNRWLLFSAIGETWVATDPKAAMAWTNRLPAGEAREAAYAGVSTGLGLPRTRRQSEGPGSRRIGARGFGGGIADASANVPGESPDFAAWRATQSPQLARDEAILEYVRQRGAADSGAIGQWLSALPGGSTRDRALEIYLEGQLIGSPQRAATWLQTLPRSDRTDDLLERTARRWLLSDPDAAKAWLRDAPLPPFRKEQLLLEAGK